MNDRIDCKMNDWPQRLLAFYQDSNRDLPWRKTHDPYAIYVSEVMLQQTQVQTVIPYYERFLARFPDIDSLSQADPDELHKFWEGLGYYARARQMQKAAVLMVADHGSQVPVDQKDLLALPGIGEYTAGAISSIAFGKAVPAVDGNVVRVFARLYALPLTQGLASDRDRVTELVEPLIPLDAPGDFNQALMELGALICTPVNPKCALCPLQPDCTAFKLGRVAEFPQKSSKKPIPEESWTTVAIKTGPYYRVKRRTERLLSGLYQFDLLPGRFDESEVRKYLHTLCISGSPIDKSTHNSCQTESVSVKKLPDRIHRFTHRIWRLGGYFAVWSGNGSNPIADSEYVYVTHEELLRLPFPTAFSAYRDDVLSLDG